MTCLLLNWICYKNDFIAAIKSVCTVYSDWQTYIKTVSCKSSYIFFMVFLIFLLLHHPIWQELMAFSVIIVIQELTTRTKKTNKQKWTHAYIIISSLYSMYLCFVKILAVLPQSPVLQTCNRICQVTWRKQCGLFNLSWVGQDL